MEEVGIEDVPDFDLATISIGKKAAEFDDGSSSASSCHSGNNKRKKTKVRKDNVCLVDIKYNKPAGGISSNTVFVGMEDDSENSPSIANEFPVMNGDSGMFRKPNIPPALVNSMDENSSSPPQTCMDGDSEENLSIDDDPEDQVETEVFLDEIVKLKSQLKLAQKELKLLSEEKEKLKSALDEEKSSVKSDSKKVQKDCEKIREKYEALKKELSEKSEQCSVLTLEKSAFLDRLKTLEKENEKLQFKINQEMFNGQSEDKHRAVCAEVTVLTLQRNYELEMKERALNDVKKIITHMDSIVDKLQGQECVEAHKYQEEFTTIMNKLENDMRSIKKQFDEQIELIKKGALLSSLKRVETPRLLTPPPLIKLSSVINRQAAITNRNVSAENYQQDSTANHFPNGAVAPPLAPPQQQPFYPNFYPFPSPMLRLPNNVTPNLMTQNSFHPTAVPFDNVVRPAPIQPPAGFYGKPVKLPEVKPPGLDTSYGDPMQLVKQMRSNSSSGSGVSAASMSKVNITPSVRNDMRVPDSTVVAPTTPAKATIEAAQPRPNSKFNQIFDHFAVLFPIATQEQVRNAIQEFRENQADKKLSGKTMSQLKAGVEEILKKKFENIQTAHSASQTRASSVLSNRSSTYKDSSSNAATRSSITPMPQSLPIASRQNSPPRLQKQAPEECCICLETMSAGERLRLDCEHEAHKECLHGWLSENKTCPMCRKLALLEDEYPRL